MVCMTVVFVFMWIGNNNGAYLLLYCYTENADIVWIFNVCFQNKLYEINRYAIKNQTWDNVFLCLLELM